MIGVVGGEGRAPCFDKSTCQHVRSGENGLIPTYLSESAQAFLPEFVRSWNRVQGLECHRSVTNAGGGTPRHSSHPIQEVHEAKDIWASQSRHEVPISFEMEKVVEDAPGF